MLYYVDPMHPSYRSLQPGKAPDCGMDLQPVYANTAAMAAGSVRLTESRSRPAICRPNWWKRRPHPAPCAPRAASLPMRAAPIASPPASMVGSGASSPIAPETRSRADEALAAFYSKDISAPQQAYVYALEAHERLARQSISLPPNPSHSLTNNSPPRAIISNSSAWAGAQMEELSRTRREIFDINLTAPADGRILERHVAVGQRFMKGELLYRIANLDHVWVLADMQRGQDALLGTIAASPNPRTGPAASGGPRRARHSAIR